PNEGQALWRTHMLQVHLGAPMWCRQKQAGEGTEQTFRRGQLTLVPALVDAACWRRTPVSFARLQLPNALLAEVGLERMEPERMFHRFDDPVIRELTFSILERAGIEGEASLCYVQSASLVIAQRIAQLTRQSRQRRFIPSAGRGLPEPALRRVLARLHEALDRNPSIEELAALAGLQAAHFSRMFRRSTGLPPHRYLQQLRLEKARALLEAGEHSVLEVALAVGFSNPSHFAAFYRKHCGLSPSEQRRRAARVLR
ncbi:MAG TPA: helix-turn-helix domain-containing protein, partial [Polyangiaceae bacterium]|nr:helix-turn-helix domain-containing protein [Polyangiaceae bacterium]